MQSPELREPMPMQDVHQRRADRLAEVMTIYIGSDGEATKALYERLEQCGPIGVIALNLFRAQKNSERAKAYRGGGYRGMAYDRKQWAMNNLVIELQKYCQVDAPAVGINWGWGEDPAQEFHRWVLYVDVPSGQVSFHTDARGAGPDYNGRWDGVRGVCSQRICSFIADVLADAEARRVET